MFRTGGEISILFVSKLAGWVFDPLSVGWDPLKHCQPHFITASTESAAGDAGDWVQVSKLTPDPVQSWPTVLGHP